MREIRITEIEGIKIGHAQDMVGGTGCTAIICEKSATAGVDVRGSAPASRETELLKSVNMVSQIHCVMLSGGSAYGLSAADGAMRYLEERNIGFNVGVGVVPIVCGASLFDLVVGDSKCRPDSDMGYAACVNSAENQDLQGNVGAGTGASVGKYCGVERMMKGGLGTYAVQIGDVKCGAIVALNALGDVIDSDTQEMLAGLLNEDKTDMIKTTDVMFDKISKDVDVFSGNTTLGCIITNAKLNKPQCNKLASIAHNGYAKAISPVHTSADGDSIFAMATGDVDVNPDALGALATHVMAKAIANAVLNAKPAFGLLAASSIK